MLLSDIEREITKNVVQRFLYEKKPSPRKLLARRFRSSQSFYRLTGWNILTNAAANAPTGEEEYLPRALAFYYAGDPEALRMARQSVSIVVRSLQSLFDVEPDKTQFTPGDLKAHADKILDPPPEQDMLRLGLYLAHDISVLSVWSPADAIEPAFFRIAEHIVEILDFDKVGDDFVTRSAGSEDQVQHAVPEIDLADSCEYLEFTDLGWPLIHPEIAEVAKTRFDTEHFADAAEAAFKLINERIKKIVRDRTGRECDGVALMQKAFSKDKPVLVLGDLSTMIGEDMQVGYQQIFSGAMRGIRNPKAHANVQIDAVRSMHFIFLASLLMFKVDEALTLEASSAASSGAGNVSV